MAQSKKVPQSVYRLQLGARLRELRELAELTGVDAARLARTNPGSLSRVESGIRGTSLEVVERLLDCYSVTDQQVRSEILELARADLAQRRRPAWWKRHSAVLSATQFEGYLALEASARVLRNYEPQLVPGLLQTEDYAWTVITGMMPALPASQIKSFLDVRIRRQRRLEDEAPVDFHVLIEESALLRPVGGRQVMLGQLRHLLEVSQKSNISIRLLPNDIGCHPGLSGNFVIMTFSEADRHVIWLDTMNHGVYFEDEADVERYIEVWEGLWALALSPTRTRTRLKEMIKELSQ